MYSAEKKTKIDDFYILISNSAHPGIKNAIGDFDYHKELSSDVLSISLALAAANLLAVNETHFDRIYKEESEDIDRIINRVTQELDGFMVDIIPNHPQIKTKLNLNPGNF